MFNSSTSEGRSDEGTNVGDVDLASATSGSSTEAGTSAIAATAHTAIESAATGRC